MYEVRNMQFGWTPHVQNRSQRWHITAQVWERERVGFVPDVQTFTEVALIVLQFDQDLSREFSERWSRIEVAIDGDYTEYVDEDDKQYEDTVEFYESYDRRPPSQLKRCRFRDEIKTVMRKWEAISEIASPHVTY